MQSAAAEHERFEAPSDLAALEGLAAAAEHVDGEGGGHVRRVADLAALIAERMGLGEEEVTRIRWAARLHDIGKAGVPAEVLSMPGRGSELDVLIRQTHALLGAYIMAPDRRLDCATEIALAHHEHWDGTGYPRGLAGDAIPLHARIVAVADVFDALTHERPYKRAWPESEAVAEIRAQRGHQFDPRVVDAFLALHEMGDVGWAMSPAEAVA